MFKMKIWTIELRTIIMASFFSLTVNIRPIFAIYRMGQNTARFFHCNNILYCQTIFIILVHLGFPVLVSM